MNKHIDKLLRATGLKKLPRQKYPVSKSMENMMSDKGIPRSTSFINFPVVGPPTPHFKDWWKANSKPMQMQFIHSQVKALRGMIKSYNKEDGIRPILQAGLQSRPNKQLSVGARMGRNKRPRR